jgi:Uma2 family endonuclease
MATPVGKKMEPLVPLPTVPSAAAWRAMTPDERMDFQVRVLDALNAEPEAMGEGRPHKKAKSRTVDALNLHFRTTGRVVYLAEEMAVLYPGQKPFSPDILAVLDVEEPEDDERMSWSVTDEGRGLDFVLEVLHEGHRDKDLVTNVERYASLGIPEYFVYDRARQQIRGHRLPPGASRYQPVVPQLGQYHSAVLQVEAAIVDGNLRWFVGQAELPGSADLIRRLSGMLASVEAKAQQAQTQAEQAQAVAAARAVLITLQARGFDVPDAVRERILAEKEAGRLDRWLGKAAVATSLADVLEEPG